MTDMAAIAALEEEFVWSFAAAPQSDIVAAMFYQERRPWNSRLVLVDATVSPVRVVERPLDSLDEGGRGTELLWAGDERLLVIPNKEDSGLMLFDSSLNPVSSAGFNVDLRDPDLLGDRVFGLDLSGFGALSLVSADMDSGESVEHRKFANDDVLTLVSVPGDTVITSRPAAVTEATNIPANADTMSNSQPQAVDGSEELTSTTGDAGFGGRDIAMWSAISFGGLAALLFGFVGLRMFILRRSEPT
jgi:hypothetical protein